MRFRSYKLPLLISVLLAATLAQSQPPTLALNNLKAAVQKISQGKAKEGVQLLLPLIKEEGSSALLLSFLYEYGIGVPKDPVRAYSLMEAANTNSWASGSSDLSVLGQKLDSLKVKAKEKAAELLKKLDLDQRQQARNLPYGEEVKLDWACDYSGTRISGPMMTYPAAESANRLVEQICATNSMAPNFEVREGQVPNAAAVVYGTRRLILYNPSFLREIETASASNKFALTSIMAHEIGHHVNGDTLTGTGSRPEIELKADEFSGSVVARLGGTLGQAQQVMAQLASPQGSSTHPPKDQRLRAIEKGWSNASGQPAPVRQPTLPYPSPSRYPSRPTSSPAGPYEPQVTIARYCTTNAGACPMQMAVPVGSTCYCSTPYGQGIPGIAR